MKKMILSILLVTFSYGESNDITPYHYQWKSTKRCTLFLRIAASSTRSKNYPNAQLNIALYDSCSNDAMRLPFNEFIKRWKKFQKDSVSLKKY
jgi:hypothetical protein